MKRRKEQKRFFRKRLRRQNSDGKMKKNVSRKFSGKIISQNRYGKIPGTHKSAGRTEYGKICNYDR